jgi:hypothetical protein
VFKFIRQVQRRRAVVILVSDFLDESDWDTLMGSLARRHKVHALLVTDPLDEGFRKLGLTEVVDAETGKRRVVDGRFTRPVQSVDARLRRLRRTGAGAVAISTDDDPFQVLHGYFQASGRRR